MRPAPRREPAAVKQEPFWLKVLDRTAPLAPPSVVGAGSLAALVNAVNYAKLLRIAQQVAPVGEEMVELAAPLLHE